MVFLFFTSTFLFFKAYGFPFSGALVLCITLALSQFHSPRSRLGFLLLPACICVLSLWDGSSPEEILDIICISLAGMIWGGGLSFLGARLPAFKEVLATLLLAIACMLSFARREYSPFLIPLLSLELLPSVPKQFRYGILLFANIAASFWIFSGPYDLASEPSLVKVALLSLGMVWVLRKGSTEFLSKFLYFTFFLLISLSHPGKEFVVLGLGLYFSYLQEGTWGLESGREA
ncbi:hypothetical protein EHQ53_02180 [Leptospira langatensis]|uniref:Uncharacterized protein n=1 Tax=Leptospira langatensis TaxID=2484983 RepID=A0A5F1ZX68_9LEPT|nr:hypothetical protein [Leptospira langatensis]TGJ98551.1 hypothetical protein EHO57_18320 [Leptospira langatensis]TGL43465.1 hypothetical protein EHQ53_02180 [Leptospira langatensis]